MIMSDVLLDFLLFKVTTIKSYAATHQTQTTFCLFLGYGLTESCACGTIMDSDDWSTGAAGPPLQGVQIQLINWDEGNYTVNDKPNPRGKKLLDLVIRNDFYAISNLFQAK